MMKNLLRNLLWLALLLQAIAEVKQTDQDLAEQNFLCLGDFSFRCLNSTMCIFRDYLCDGIVDCDNGSDEWEEECIDRHDQQNWDIKIGHKFDDLTEHEVEQMFGDEASISCEPDTFPDVCGCKHIVVFKTATTENQTDDSQYRILATHVDCFMRNLTAVPTGIPQNVTILDLESNSIEKIHADDLAGMENLKELYLSKNDITEIENGAMKDMISLELLSLGNNFLSLIPDDIFTPLANLRYLDLSNNALRMIKKLLLESQTSLTYLSLSWNNPLEIEFGAFDNLSSLETLHLVDDGLTHIKSGMFRSLQNLTELNLERNSLLSIKKNDLIGLTKLKFLKLKNNSIRRIEAGIFDATKNIMELTLSFNYLEAVTKEVFRTLEDIQVLDLSFNKIMAVGDGALSSSGKLSHLLLSGNKIQNVCIGMLDNLTSLTNLDLFNNEIASIELGSLDDLADLITLDLRENRLSDLPRGVFKELRSLQWLYFDHFSLCGYAPTVRHCYPRGDGISSLENLLDNFILRIMVWLVATLACIGNALVPVIRCIWKEDNRVHSFFIMNLSLADFLMGLYLFIIAVRDVMYRGDYILFDLQWRTSWLCQICGFMSLISCEASVLILTVITFDRLICVVYPFKFKERRMRVASGVMVGVWAACLLLAALPLIQTIEYFDYLFYGGNGVCLPLHVDIARSNGWQYSFAIFVVINFTAFLFILYGYVQMFTSIRKSRNNVRSTSENQDLKLAKRFALIVTTDLLCWMPVIIIKFLALAGASIDPSIYAWVAIFILPVNSALNPFLYTMTTKAFKQRVHRLFGTISTERKTEYFSIRSSRTRSSASSTGSRLSENGRLHGNVYVTRLRQAPATNKSKREQPEKRLVYFGNSSVMGPRTEPVKNHRIVGIAPEENHASEKKV